MRDHIYKYALAVLSLVALGSAPARAQATDADALYQRALARLHALPQQPFIEYTMEQTNNSPDGANPFSLVEIVIERRSDRTSWNAVQAGDLPKNGVLIGRHFLIPDMFLRAGPIGGTPEEGAGALPQLDDVDGPATPTPLPLKTIATVSTRPSHRYNVSAGGVEEIPNFGKVVHIILRPTGDPEFDNVRELWIRPSDAMLYKVRYNSKLFEVRHASLANKLDVTATLNDDGLVTSWTSTGHVFVPLPGYSTIGDGTFTRFLWKDSEPDYLFDEKLWNAYANKVKASLKASPSPQPR